MSSDLGPGHKDVVYANTMGFVRSISYSYYCSLLAAKINTRPLCYSYIFLLIFIALRTNVWETSTLSSSVE